MIKVITLLKRKPGFSRAEFSRYWRDSHAKVALKFAGSRYIRRYLQNHMMDPAALGNWPGAVNTQWDGVAEVWFDSLEDLLKAMNDPDYMKVVRPDEEQFSDLAAAQTFIVEENPVIDRISAR
jgi:uncharacterized protein (TIGR02118 family)